jgi:transposase-like protein
MLRIFKEADKKQETITSLCKRYGISRKWFCKWKRGGIKKEMEV